MVLGEIFHAVYMSCIYTKTMLINSQCLYTVNNHFSIGWLFKMKNWFITKLPPDKLDGMSLVSLPEKSQGQPEQGFVIYLVVFSWNYQQRVTENF